MHFKLTSEDEQFRVYVRKFISEQWVPPAGSHGPTDDRYFDHRIQFERRLAGAGLLTLAWPPEFGGAGASAVKQLVLREETATAGAPGGAGQGIAMIGPTIMAHGTDEQKARFLPPIARAEVVWCQGFSEPNAGSDLASLQTRAIREGDEYRVVGQKVWTSDAHRADWMHLLVRTDPAAPKHRGISYLLMDMRSPGITIRPIVDMSGNHVLNEVHFDDVLVPAGQVLGEPDRGWYVATTTLEFERSGIQYPAAASRTVLAALDWARRGRHFDRTAGKLMLADLAVSIEVSRLMCYRVAWMQARGEEIRYEASLSKLFGTELMQRVHQRVTNFVGLAAQRVDPLDPEAPLLDTFMSPAAFMPVGTRYLATVPYTVAGGTSEMQRDIIARRGLNLPRA